MNMLTRLTMVAAIAGALMAPVAYAAEYEVHMLAKDANGRFAQYEPAFLKVQPGALVNATPIVASAVGAPGADAPP